MSDPVTTQASLQTTFATFNTLVPLASSIIAIIGGVPTPVTEGLAVVQALLPVAESFILKIGQKNITIDTSQANDTGAIILALNKSVADGWPSLSFTTA